MRRAAIICGIVSLVPSLLYWACITLPKSYWPLVCPWHSIAAFVLWMLAGVVLASIAAWKASRWWASAGVLAVVTLFVGGSTI